MGYLEEVRALVGNRMLLIPGVRCILLNQLDQVLLERRSDFGVWGLPGGSAEPGEDVVDTMKRELLEETGLSAEQLAPFGYGSQPAYETFKFPNGDHAQFFSLMMWGRVGGPAVPRVSAESTELEWFYLERLPDRILPNMHRSLLAFVEFRRTGKFQLI